MNIDCKMWYFKNAVKYDFWVILSKFKIPQNNNHKKPIIPTVRYVAAEIILSIKMVCLNDLDIDYSLSISPLRFLSIYSSITWI